MRKTKQTKGGTTRQGLWQCVAVQARLFILPCLPVVTRNSAALHIHTPQARQSPQARPRQEKQGSQGSKDTPRTITRRRGESSTKLTIRQRPRRYGILADVAFAALYAPCLSSTLRGRPYIPRPEEQPDNTFALQAAPSVWKVWSSVLAQVGSNDTRGRRPGVNTLPPSLPPLLHHQASNASLPFHPHYSRSLTGLLGKSTPESVWGERKGTRRNRRRRKQSSSINDKPLKPTSPSY